MGNVIDPLSVGTSLVGQVAIEPAVVETGLGELEVAPPARTQDTFVGDPSMLLLIGVRPTQQAAIPVGFAEIPSDEDQLAGSGWRREILPLALNALGERGATPLASVLNTLESPNQTVAVKVIALRMLGNNRDVLNYEDSPRIWEVVTKIFYEEQADPRLKEMALAILRQGGVADLPELPSPSAFENPPEGKKRYFTYPPWHSVLKELLDLKGEGEALLAQASDLFADVARPVWQRALALVYYSSLFFPDAKLYLSREEADEICPRLLVVLINPMEPALLKEMAANVYVRVVRNQIIFASRRKDKLMVAEALEWARGKKVEGYSDRTTVYFNGFLDSFAPRSQPKPQQPPSKPVQWLWWKRLDAWLAGLFQD